MTTIVLGVVLVVVAMVMAIGMMLLIGAAYGMGKKVGHEDVEAERANPVTATTEPPAADQPPSSSSPGAAHWIVTTDRRHDA